jgi:hypothetical protein
MIKREFFLWMIIVVFSSHSVYSQCWGHSSHLDRPTVLDSIRARDCAFQHGQAAVEAMSRGDVRRSLNEQRLSNMARDDERRIGERLRAIERERDDKRRIRERRRTIERDDNLRISPSIEKHGARRCCNCNKILRPNESRCTRSRCNAMLLGF